MSWNKLFNEMLRKAVWDFMNRATLKFLKGELLEPAEKKAINILGRKVDWEGIEEQLVKLLKKEAAFNTFVHEDKNPLAKTVKKRVIHAPNEAMRSIHKEFLRFLRNLDVKMPYATGAVSGGSPMENAKRHRNSSLFYLLDIHNFYPSFKGEKLSSVICSLSSLLRKQEKSFLRFLKRYCLDPEGGLLIGSQSSPDLANLYASVVLDGPLGKLAERYGMVYTRYLDDMTFSCPSIKRDERIATYSTRFGPKPRRNKIGKRKTRAIREPELDLYNITQNNFLQILRPDVTSGLEYDGLDILHLPPHLGIIRNGLFHQIPEFFRMIHFTKMAKFVNDYVI